MKCESKKNAPATIRGAVLGNRHQTRGQHDSRKRVAHVNKLGMCFAPFGVAYEKIGTIQRRLAWPLHKDDTLSRSGRPTGLNIYFHFSDASVAASPVAECPWLSPRSCKGTFTERPSVMVFAGLVRTSSGHDSRMFSDRFVEADTLTNLA